MLKLFRFFVVIAAFFSTMAASASFYVSPLNGPGMTIDKYFVHTGGGITLILSGYDSSIGECDYADKVHIKGGQLSSDSYKNLVSSALAAFAAGKKIGIAASTCTTIPFWGGTKKYPIVSDLWVFK